MTPDGIDNFFSIEAFGLFYFQSEKFTFELSLEVEKSTLKGSTVNSEFRVFLSIISWRNEFSFYFFALFIMEIRKNF